VYPEERQQAIAALVAERGRVAVTAVAEEFGVTTETVRRDLAVLERAGMLRRVHGGAVPAGALTLVEPGLGERTAPAASRSARSPRPRSTCCPAATAA
jgi:DeoR family fructose operon transcriptional repressor